MTNIPCDESQLEELKDSDFSEFLSNLRDICRRKIEEYEREKDPLGISGWINHEWRKMRGDWANFLSLKLGLDKIADWIDPYLEKD